MILNESYSNVVTEAKVVYARRGKSVTTQFRCTVGPRKGRVVASPAQCARPIDLKKRFVLRKTRAAKGSRMMKKAQRTKRTNPQSRVVRQLNKARR